MRYAILAAWTPAGARTAIVPFVALPPDLRRGMTPLPLYAARWVQASLEPMRWGILEHLAAGFARRRVARRLEQGLARMGLEPPGVVWCDAGRLAAVVRALAGRDADDGVRRVLEGRMLLGSELVRALHRPGGDPDAVRLAAEALVAAGAAERVAAVEVDESGARCQRCGGRHSVYPEPCGHCGSPFCPRCSRCAAMGVARGCEPLYAMSRPLLAAGGDGPDAPATAWRLAPELVGALSPAQRRAAEVLRREVAAHLRGRRGGGEPVPIGAGQGPRGCVVWAVTGAGKTEVAFGAVEVALGMGGRVLMAVPRRAIAAELAERARRAFGGQTVTLLMGRGPDGRGGAEGARSSVWREEPSPLVVATTHQALRWYRAFSLVVLDEFDAFPYAGSDMLALAVERAAHPDGYRVVMSATPGEARLASARQAGWPVIHVPARHHGHPLPVPEVRVERAVRRWEQAPDDPQRVPAFVRAWLAARRPRTRVLVFCPTVALAEGVARGLGVMVCHSAHPQRERTLARFAASQDEVLVSTTLLERGVTFAGLDVLVVFADHPAVFDEATLVQMAGRAGRSAERPDGRVLFVAATASRAMRRAVEAIEAMNRRAAAEGLLRHETTSPRTLAADVDGPAGRSRTGRRDMV